MGAGPMGSRSTGRGSTFGASRILGAGVGGGGGGATATTTGSGGSGSGGGGGGGSGGGGGGGGGAGRERSCSRAMIWSSVSTCSNSPRGEDGSEASGP